jgi:hypothetical protein
MNPIMRTAIAVAVSATLAAGVTVAAQQNGPPSKAQIEDINRRFKDRTVTAKIDLPIVRSVYVTPDGEYDRERYADRLASQPPSIPRDDTARLTKIEVDGDKVNVNINGGGMPKPRGSAVMVFGGRKSRGSRIEIEFGRKVTSADLTPEMIVRAVSRIITIEGMDASVALARPDELLGPVAATPAATAVPAPPASGPKPTASHPAVAPAAQPAKTAPSAAVGATAPSRVIVEVVSAEVTPTRLRAGDKLALTVHYDVSGLPPRTEASIVEQRQLMFDGKPLFTRALSQTVHRPNGRHSSTFDFNVPGAAKPGVYVFTVTVRAGDVSATKEALFQIMP